MKLFVAITLNQPFLNQTLFHGVNSFYAELLVPGILKATIRVYVPYEIITVCVEKDITAVPVLLL